MRTQQERRANCLYREDGQRVKWGRAKRGSYQLDPWNNEKHVTIQKSWKVKRKTQYNPQIRTTENRWETQIVNHWDERYLSEYFIKHNIPYRIIPHAYRIAHIYYQDEQITYIYKQNPFTKEWYIIQEIQRIIPPYRHCYYTTVYNYSTVIWWWDKDIGLDYILKRNRTK
jgi:hypothetical protein